MKKVYLIILAIIILILLLYFFYPLCGFNRIGSNYPAGDDCNTCSCGLFFGSCTEMACIKLPSGLSCPENDVLNCVAGGGPEGSEQYKLCNDVNYHVWMVSNCPNVKVLE